MSLWNACRKWTSIGRGGGGMANVTTDTNWKCWRKIISNLTRFYWATLQVAKSAFSFLSLNTHFHKCFEWDSRFSSISFEPMKSGRMAFWLLFCEKIIRYKNNDLKLFKTYKIITFIFWWNILICRKTKDKIYTF